LVPGTVPGTIPNVVNVWKMASYFRYFGEGPFEQVYKEVLMQNKSLLVKNLSKSYSQIQGKLDVLKELNFSLEGGQKMVVTGPSGSGKSTLLNIIGTLDTADEGKVFLNGRELNHLPEGELSLVRRDVIGLVFQDHHLLPQCTALENVLLPALFKKSRSEPLARAKHLLDALSLGTHHNSFPAELSGGEKQRVAIARALINRPSLLLCDEPTGNLDRKSAGQFLDLLLTLEKEAMVILVTHNLEMAASFDAWYELQLGKLHKKK